MKIAHSLHTLKQETRLSSSIGRRQFNSATMMHFAVFAIYYAIFSSSQKDFTQQQVCRTASNPKTNRQIHIPLILTKNTPERCGRIATFSSCGARDLARNAIPLILSLR